MKSLFKYAILLSTVGSLLSACTSNISNNSISQMGHPRIIFVDPPANLTPEVRHSVGSAGYQANASNVAAAYAISNGVSSILDYETNSSEQKIIDAYKSKISKLDFDDQMYTAFFDVLNRAKNFKGVEIERRNSKDVGDQDDYMRKSKADSILFVIPKFSMLPGNQVFHVDVLIELVKLDDRDPEIVQKLARQDFSFNNKLSLAKPGISWATQKQLAHEVAAMDSGQAMATWFADDAELLRRDFSANMEQINAGMAHFFGLKHDTSRP